MIVVQAKGDELAFERPTIMGEGMCMTEQDGISASKVSRKDRWHSTVST